MLDPPPATAGSSLRVAVVRVLPGLGDLLCAVPALRALRAAAPDADVTFVGMPGAEWFAARFGAYIDHLLPCPCWPGLPEVDGDRRKSEEFVARATRQCFDLAIQMHGDGRVSNVLTAALGARRWVGTTTDPTRIGRHGNVTLGPYRADRHEVERCLDVVRLALGAPTGDDGTGEDTALEFPLTDAERAMAARGRDSGRPYVVVHPGASVPERRWPSTAFAEVVTHIARRVDVVLTGGPDEVPLTAAVAAAAQSHPGRVRDLAGATTIGELGAVVAGAVLLVSNDTGPIHLAAAVGTPTIAVCNGSDVARWAPRDRRHRSVAATPGGRWPPAAVVCAAADSALAAAWRAGAGDAAG